MSEYVICDECDAHHHHDEMIDVCGECGNCVEHCAGYAECPKDPSLACDRCATHTENGEGHYLDGQRVCQDCFYIHA